MPQQSHVRCVAYYLFTNDLCLVDRASQHTPTMKTPACQTAASSKDGFSNFVLRSPFTLIVRYAMTLCPEACCSGRVSIATAIDFILAGLYCERLVNRDV